MSIAPHPDEAHEARLAQRLNNLRAAVLGANDGIVSEAGLVIGVAGATTARAPLLTAGLAGLAAGAVSMALGEYVSVSSQRDAERDQLALERRELAEDPAGELAELAALYQAKGLSPATARRVAEELTAADALTAHAEAELHLDPKDLVDPIRAAVASAVSFTLGAAIPLLAITLPAPQWRVRVAVTVVLATLTVAGLLVARVGGGRPGRAVLRVLVGGSIGLAFTHLVGHLAGVATG
ncbi:MAG TPA: VIT family protein [Sporichthyaceae bacterium]|jgi:VIT1/CCC1 family predicted Fe2+/Mn2+ transporter|nr:VIT family protein [Sporichthyaceae bacterium]